MASEVKRLYRSRRDRMIAGVCGGIGEYLDIDPTIVRLLFVSGAFLGGPGLLVYFVMMLVVPEEPLATISDAPVEDEPPEEQPKPKRASRKKAAP